MAELIGGESIESIILFLIIVTLTVIVANSVYAVLRFLFERKFSRRVSKNFAKVFQYGILIYGFYYGVNHILQLNLAALATSLGIIGIVVAFSSQQIMQNFLAGMMIAIQSPVRLEDWISVAFPETGINRVKDIGLTRTILEGRDGRTIFIPNSILITSKVINYTKMDFIQIPVNFNIPIKSYEKAKKIIFEVVNKHNKILPNVSKKERFAIEKFLKLDKTSLKDEKYKPQIIISDISNGVATTTLNIWIVEIQNREKIISEVLEQTMIQFKKAKIN